MTAPSRAPGRAYDRGRPADPSPADTGEHGEEPALAFVTSVGNAHEPHVDRRRARRSPARVGVTNAVAGDPARRHRDRRFTGIVTVHPTDQAITRRCSDRGAALAFARRYCSPPATSLASRATASRSRSRRTELPGRRDPPSITAWRRASAFTARSSSTSTAPRSRERTSSNEVYRAIVEAVSPAGHAAHVRHRGGGKFASTFQMPAMRTCAWPSACAVRLAPVSLRSSPSFRATAPYARRRTQSDPRSRRCTTMRECKAHGAGGRASAAREASFRGASPRHDDRGPGRGRGHGDIFAREAEFFSLRHERPVQFRSRSTERAVAARASEPLFQSRDPPAHQGRHRRGPSLRERPVSAPARYSIRRACPSSARPPRPLDGGAAIPEIKEAIRRLTVAECEALAEQALACDSAEAVEEMFQRASRVASPTSLAGLRRRRASSARAPVSRRCR